MLDSLDSTQSTPNLQLVTYAEIRRQISLSLLVLGEWQGGRLPGILEGLLYQ